MEKYTAFHGLEALAWRALGELYGELGDQDADRPMCKESKRGAVPELHMFMLNQPVFIRYRRRRYRRRR